MSDTSVFPDPAYKRTVLEPLFDSVKAHHTQAFNAINRAHLVMLHEAGILSASTARDLARALADINENLDLAALEYTGEHEDFFFLIEAELTARLGPDIAGMLHTARSRNDIDHTVFRITLKARTDALTDQGLALAGAMLATAWRERDTMIVAYTHGQPAQPSTFGHYLGAALEVLLRDLTRLAAERENLDLCPMGAAAITTTGFAIDRRRVAELLGFAAPTRNSYGSIAAIDYITGTYSAIKLIFLHLGRLIQDFQTWASFEVGQMRVPNSLVQISSIMPQKRNPVPIEHLRLLSSLTAGRCDTIINTMHNTPFTDMNDSEGEVQQAGYAAFESGGRALDLLAVLIPACTIQTDRVAKNADAACITITELADTLVRDEALSFRQAHEIAARTAHAVIDAGQPLGAGYNAFAAAYIELTGRETGLAEEDFARAASQANFIAVRDRHGGPAPAALDAAFEVYGQTLAGLQTHHQAHAARKADAAGALDAAFLRVHG